MNDAEARRRELLRQTRKLYHDGQEPPAVHPRYGRIYHSLYENTEEAEEPVTGSFYTRLVIGILCFLCFVCMDQNKISVAEVDSSVIADQIGKNLDIEEIREVWNSF